jgi:hypothetical protein
MVSSTFFQSFADCRYPFEQAGRGLEKLFWTGIS